MNICVRGIGWLTKEGYGGIRTGTRYSFGAEEGLHAIPKKAFFALPFKNFGRLDAISRMTVCAAALALKDAGMEYSAKKQDIGIIGTCSTGSLATDLDYFKDYVGGGRTLSRANLFIYTLPSSPLGEAAIHFGCTGPLLFAAQHAQPLQSVLDTAAEMLHAREANAMLAGRAEQDEAVYFILQEQQAQNPFCDLDAVRTLASSENTISGLIRSLSVLSDRKGRV